MVDKKVQKMYNNGKEGDHHEKMVSKINGGYHSGSLLIRRGNDWSCSGFSATTAIDSGSGEHLHRGCLWVTVGVRRVE